MKVSPISLSRSRAWVLAASASLLAVAVGAFAAVTPIFHVQGLIEPTSSAISVPAAPPIIGDAVVAINEATVAPGDVIGWHYHTGYAFTVVKSGTLTEFDGCGNVISHPAGTAFVEVPGHVHEVKNEGTDTVDIYWSIVHPADKPGGVNLAGPSCQDVANP